MNARARLANVIVSRRDDYRGTDRSGSRSTLPPPPSLCLSVCLSVCLSLADLADVETMIVGAKERRDRASRSPFRDADRRGAAAPLFLLRARECCGSAGRCETIELAREISLSIGHRRRMLLRRKPLCYLSEFRITGRETTRAE